MIAKDAQRRLEILGFWRRHGAAATCEAFKLSRRTLYLWRAKLKAEGGNVTALVPGSTAPKRRRRRQWPALLIAEIRRLRTLHPNLAKEKLYLLLGPVAAAHQLPCPSARTGLAATANRHRYADPGCASRSISMLNVPAIA